MYKHLIAKRPFGLFFFTAGPSQNKKRLPGGRQRDPGLCSGESGLACSGAAGQPAAPWWKAACAAACLAASVVPSPAPAQARLLPTTSLTLGSATVHVEIAATPENRNRGLMFRESLPPDHGMLFVFEQDTTQCFWMKNTPLPLTIAFVDAQGHIINMRDMQPYSEATHCPAAPMRYALEMPQGWFLQYGIKAGEQVKGLP